MALTFGRRRTAPAEHLGDTAIARELRQASEDRFTGALELNERPHHGHARLYLFEGGLYSFGMDGLDLDVIARLVSSGALSADAAADLSGERRPEVAAVRRGLVSLDALATVHQEYLLAAAGAVLGSQTARPRRRPGETTDTLCTLPLSVADVLAAVEVRRDRLVGTWPVVSSRLTPSTAVLRTTATSAAMPSALPELSHLAGAFDGQRSLDAVASSLGLTRAEAVHLAGALVASGHAIVLENAAAVEPDRLLVPEAFGEVDRTGVPEANARVAAMPESPATPSVSSARIPQNPRVRELEGELAEAMEQEREVAARIAAVTAELQQLREAASIGNDPT